MFQVMSDGLIAYVVDLQEFPPEMPVNDGGDPALTQYAKALTNAINDGIVTGPGKYAIRVDPVNQTWLAYKIIE